MALQNSNALPFECSALRKKNIGVKIPLEILKISIKSKNFGGKYALDSVELC